MQSLLYLLNYLARQNIDVDICTVCIYAFCTHCALPVREHKYACIRAYCESSMQVSLPGPANFNGNHFTDISVFGTFSCPPLAQHKRVRGFYDGDGIHKIRFMPQQPGNCTYITDSTTPTLNKKSGSFQVLPLPVGKYGQSPVRVRNTRSFVHEDGSTHFSVGTTSYAWIHQNDTMIHNTVATLSDPATPFNKMRMTVFPKWYWYATSSSNNNKNMIKNDKKKIIINKKIVLHT